MAAREPDCEWIAGDIYRWHADGRKEEQGFFTTHPRARALLGEPADDSVVHLRRPVEQFIRMLLSWTSVTMVKRELLLYVGACDEARNLRAVEDHHLCIRLALQADFWFVSTPLALYRLHDANISLDLLPTQAPIISAMTMLMADPNLGAYRAHFREKLAECHRSQGWHHRNERRFLSAAAAFARAIALQPAKALNWRCLVGSLLRRA